MGVLSQKEMCSLAEEFFEYLKMKSYIGQTLQRDYLHNHVYPEFKSLRKSEEKKVASFSSVLFFMKSTGIVKRNHNDTVTLVSCEKFQAVMNPVIAVDAMAVQKRKQARQKSKKQELRKKLVGAAAVDPSDMSERKMGVEISCLPPCTEGKPGHFTCAVADEKKSSLKIVIKNNASSTIFLLGCYVLSKHSEITLPEIDQDHRRSICPGQECIIDVRCNVKWQEIGACTTELMFKFCQTKAEQTSTFESVKYVRFEKSNALIDQLRPKQPYVRPAKVTWVQRKVIMPGKRPRGLSTDMLERILPLKEYGVPNNVKSAVRDGAFVRDADVNGYKKLRGALENSLSASNYSERFHLLLNLEELQNTFDIRRYDMSSVTLKRGGGLMYLRVPGLAEKRPSVLRGDRIYATKVGNDSAAVLKEFEGYVHVVERDRVGLGFHEDLRSKHTQEMRYNVRFTFNRLPIKLAHRAISMKLPQEMLFPRGCGVLYSDIKISKQDFINAAVATNPEQSKAVNNIVRGKQCSVPYIVFGPPGTGKTVTIVEAILQIVRIYECCHILVCAPSNNACDLLTQKLLKHVRPSNILRMHAASRNWQEVPKDVQLVSNHRESDFYFPRKEELGDYEIVVCTLITAGRLASAKFPDDHFTHAFIDEAGQATEPECMVALGGVLAVGGQVVMAGDPKQLGPVIMSAVAREYGLGVSYLERVMETEALYQKDEKQSYNAQYITKLLINYRSHKSIIKVPNGCFYENELVAAADEQIAKSMCSWQHLPQQGFPVIFEGVRGEDLRESVSPSYYNPQEIFIVKTYVEKILVSGVAADEIGVITPYRKQVQKLRTVISNADVKVGSVEEFQGQEKRVIVISTVRSDSQHLLFDASHHLGFLCNPKRFNVAVTRAKSLLIVVGNPHLLSLDYHWKILLEHCIDHSAYRGIEYSKDERRDVDVEELERIFEATMRVSDSDE